MTVKKTIEVGTINIVMIRNFNGGQLSKVPVSFIMGKKVHREWAVVLLTEVEVVDLQIDVQIRTNRIQVMQKEEAVKIQVMQKDKTIKIRSLIYR